MDGKGVGEWPKLWPTDNGRGGWMGKVLANGGNYGQPPRPYKIVGVGGRQSAMISAGHNHVATDCLPRVAWLNYHKGARRLDGKGVGE